MKNILGLVVCVFLVLRLNSQSVPVELMVGDRSVWYQHSVSRQLGETAFGVFHTSSLLSPHSNEMKDELMSQLYLTYQIAKGIKVGAGSFYSTVPGFHPSINVQFAHGSEDHFILVVPRVDVSQNPSYDIMVLAEYKPKLLTEVRLYTRFQTMINYTGTIHNRSYQNFRLGFDFGFVQTGLAVNFDAYGKDKEYTANYGWFLKKDFR